MIMCIKLMFNGHTTTNSDMCFSISVPHRVAGTNYKRLPEALEFEIINSIAFIVH